MKIFKFISLVWLVFAVIFVAAMIGLIIMLKNCGGNETDPLEIGDLIIDGDYAYDYVEENGIKIGIRIVTLSNEGREKERLEVPAELGGLPVLHIGRESPQLELPMERHASSLRGHKLKKIILPYTIEEAWEDCFYSKPFGDRDGKWVEKIIFVETPYIRGFFLQQGRYYYAGEDPEYRKVCNVEFHFNFEGANNKGIYSGDHLDKHELFVKPETDPKREGYDFAGWYTEPECINAWDFDNKHTDDRIIKLYAKWTVKAEN